jgi:predicted negative regulator of RcsB-dependent stress response
MDDYLTEKEQIELIRRWWRENGWFLIGGAAVVALGYFGWQQYQAYQQRVAEQASTLYHELVQVVEDDDREQADELLARLAEDFSSSAYLDQARLLIASDSLIRDTQRSIDELTTVMEQSRDEGTATIARMRLARVLAYDEQYDRALAVLNVPDSGEFTARFSEIRGDIFAATGDVQAAIDEYTDALLASGNGTVDPEYLQLKLNDLVQDSVAEPAAAGDGG